MASDVMSQCYTKKEGLGSRASEAKYDATHSHSSDLLENGLAKAPQQRFGNENNSRNFRIKARNSFVRLGKGVE